MTREEFLTVLKILDVKEHGGEFRIKGFLLEYVRSPISDYVMLQGKIPYSLAEVIYQEANKYKLNPYCFNIAYKDNTNQKYIDRIKIDSDEALKFIIETIREHPFINEWAIGNY